MINVLEHNARSVCGATHVIYNFLVEVEGVKSVRTFEVSNSVRGPRIATDQEFYEFASSNGQLTREEVKFVA
jgi:hypothetical protein